MEVVAQLSAIRVCEAQICAGYDRTRRESCSGQIDKHLIIGKCRAGIIDRYVAVVLPASAAVIGKSACPPPNSIKILLILF